MDNLEATTSYISERRMYRQVRAISLTTNPKLDEYRFDTRLTTTVEYDLYRPGETYALFIKLLMRTGEERNKLFEKLVLNGVPSAILTAALDFNAHGMGETALSTAAAILQRKGDRSFDVYRTLFSRNSIYSDYFLQDALESTGGTEIFKEYCRLLVSNPCSEVRQQLVEYLGNSKNDLGDPFLQQLSNDKDPSVRSLAKDFLDDQGSS